MLNVEKGDRFSKLIEPKTFRHFHSYGGAANLPDSVPSVGLADVVKPNRGGKERNIVPVSS